jgi:hypothetical protein
MSPGPARRRRSTGVALAVLLGVAGIGGPACAGPRDDAGDVRSPGSIEPDSASDPLTTAAAVVAADPQHESLTADTTTTTVRSGRPGRGGPPSLAQQLGEDVGANQLRVPPEPAAEGTWRFIGEDPSGPVAFDACRPIHYRVRVGPGPADGAALVTEALDRVSQATGLRFVDDGPVEAAPTSASFPSPNTKVDLDEAFAPAVIGWAHRDETDLWATDSEDTLGTGGQRTIMFTDGRKLAVSGFALLVPSDALADGFGPGMTVGNVLLHEVGHLVGLDHVEDRAEIMQARFDRSIPDGWGAGDRRGLWLLGASRGCASSSLHVGG